MYLVIADDVLIVGYDADGRHNDRILKQICRYAVKKI